MHSFLHPAPLSCISLTKRHIFYPGHTIDKSIIFSLASYWNSTSLPSQCIRSVDNMPERLVSPEMNSARRPMKVPESLGPGYKSLSHTTLSPSSSPTMPYIKTADGLTFHYVVPSSDDARLDPGKQTLLLLHPRIFDLKILEPQFNCKRLSQRYNLVC